MSPAEIVEMTGAVARTFGEDIAHEVCRVYLDTQPVLTSESSRWWLRTARYLRIRAHARETVRRASRYRKEMSMRQRRVLTPEQTASCWELIERVPRAVTEEIMMLEDRPGAPASWRRKHLRQRALRAAGLVVTLLLLGLAVPAWAGQNVLTWTDNSSNEQNFNIERKTEACAGGAAFVPLATVGLNVVTFTDLAVSEGQTYCYRISASNTAGASVFSNTAARTVPFTVPNAPSGLSVN